MRYLEPPQDELAIRNFSRELEQQILPPFPGETRTVTANTASFQDFFRILRRHKWMILSLLAIGAAGAIGLQFAVPKVYEGEAMVKIDRHTNSIDTQPGQYSGPTDDMDQIITTEMEMAQSDTVLRPVAERFNLWEVEKQTRGLTANEVQELLRAPVELKKLKIKRPPNSYLLKIIYRAHDPALAADVANAVAESLAQHSNDTGRKSLIETSSVVAANLANMRAKMDEADNQLAAYERELGVVDPEQRATVLSSRLKDLITDLTTAQSDRASREATLEQVKRAARISPDDALAAAQVADALATPYGSGIADALSRLNDAKASYARTSAFYGSEHPENARAKQQVEELQRQLTAMLAGAVNRAQISYDQALSREKNLQALAATTKAEVDAMQANAAHYDQMRDEAQNYRRFYNDLEGRATIADINKSFDADSVKLFTSARAPSEYIFPKLILDLPLALVLSLLLGVVAAVLMDAVDSRFAGADEVADQLKLDVLATIPESKQLVAATGPRTLTVLAPKEQSKRAQRKAAQYREAIRELRTAISFSLLDGSIKTLQVTSSVPGEGKTTTCSSLAVSYAQAGKRVLLIDADMRRPNVHRIFGITASPGLSEVLAGEVALAEAMRTIEPGLFVLPAGPTSSRAAELITLQLAQLLAKAAREYDLVMIDSPPVHGAAEALDIARMADSTLLVVNAEKTIGRLVSSTVAALRRARGQILGIAMNRARSFGDRTNIYSYDYEPDLTANNADDLPSNMVAADTKTAL